MADFMVGNRQFIFFREDRIFPLVAGQNDFQSILQIGLSDLAASFLYGMESAFIYQIGKVSSGAAGCILCDSFQINILRHFDCFCMHPQNRLSAGNIRQFEWNAPVKTPWPQQRFVKNFRFVRCRQDHHAFFRGKTVHFIQQLVERLVPLIISGDSRQVTALADRIDFINEDDAGGFCLGLIEQISHPGCSDTDKHLHKF